MEIRNLRKEDINEVVDIINRNYDEVMIKEHLKEVLERFNLKCL